MNEKKKKEREAEMNIYGKIRPVRFGSSAQRQRYIYSDILNDKDTIMQYHYPIALKKYFDVTRY